MTPPDTTNAPLPGDPMIERAADAAARTYSFSPGDTMRFMGTEAPGQPDFFDETAPRGTSAPLHRHPWASWELVLEGRVRFVIDDNETVLEDGDFVYTPPDAVHTYVVESDSARVIGFNHPGGHFERLQRTVGPMFLDGPPDMAKAAAAAGECHVEILGPPLQLAE